MKIVVSNSSPICYQILINQIHLLHEIVGAILIPEAVVRELGDMVVMDEKAARKIARTVCNSMARNSIRSGQAEYG